MGKKSIMRSTKRENPYLMIDKTGLRDPNLSWEAKGLLAYILTLPDDWQIYLRELYTHAKNGRDSTARILNELIEKKYVIRGKRRNELKQFDGYEYVVYEIPQTEENKVFEPCTEKPYTDTPNTGKPTLLNKDITEHKQTNNNNDSLLGENSGNSEIDEAQEVIETFNDICSDLPSVSQVTNKRTNKITKIKNELIRGGYKPLTVFKAVFLKVHTTKFFNGNNRLKWRATFDWLLEEDRIIRILEGQYDAETLEGDIGQAVLSREVI